MNYGIMRESKEKKKVLLTGIAGFIGFHEALRLLKSNYQVVGIDNLNDYYDVSLKVSRLNELGISIGSPKSKKYGTLLFTSFTLPKSLQFWICLREKSLIL